MTTIRITVTKEILEKSKNCGSEGKEYYPTNCAVAVAVIGIWPRAFVQTDVIFPFGYDHGNVDHKDASRYGVTIENVAFAVPDAMSKFITLFDNTEQDDRPLLHEQSFELEVPDWALPEVDLKELLKDSKTLAIV